MVKTPLGRLERVNLRQYWDNEARDFTPWLAEPENIVLLGETLGMQLEVQATEESVGPFRADILCKEVGTERVVLIENQLERTDHNHLGQILTYAAGLNAVAIIWIAPKFTDEHRAAMDWLNRITSEAAHFFGLEIELWRIGDSVPAPKFNIVCQPNEWTNQITAGSKGDISPTRALQLEYWTGFAEYLRERGYAKIPKPQPGNWIAFSMGRSGFWLSTSVANAQNSSMGESNCAVCLNIDHAQAKPFFDQLYTQRADIEAVLDATITWNRYDKGKGSYILTWTKADYRIREDWPQQYAWLYDHLIRFQQVFAQRIKTLKLPKGLE